MRRALVVLLVLSLAAGCSDRKNPANVDFVPPTLEQIWPSTEGLLWTYTSVSRGWDPPPLLAVYATIAEVPPVNFDTVAAVLALRASGANVTRDTSQLQLIFSDEIDLPNGQRAKTLFELPVGTTAAGRFLRGGYWRRTPEWIGLLSLFETPPTWKFLQGPLIPGTLFAAVPQPDIAPSVVQYGKVVGSRAIETPLGTIPNGIEVHYYLDFGISAQTDAAGNFVGLARQFSCASVLYAPGVGPVLDFEIGGLFAGQALRPGYGDLTIRLVQGPAQTAVASRVER